MNISDNIIYIDESIIIVNKPPGLRTIPDGYNKDLENLQSLLKIEFTVIWTVHRLDKDTSGVIIFARNAEVHKNLNYQFENRLIKKTYIAIVHNIPDWKDYQAALPLLVNSDRNHRTIINHLGKPSVTNFVKLDQDTTENLSYLQAKLLTGYTHQIRSHLSYLGYPILGDKLYYKNLSKTQKENNQQVNRLMLHASTIEFLHPVTNTNTVISTRVPFSLKI